MYNFLFSLLIFTTTINFVAAQTCDLIFEDWENATNANPPAGWQRIDSYVRTLGNSAYSGDTFAGMNTTGDQWIVKPLTCPGEICFYWRASGASSNYDIDIDWSIDNGTNWTTAHTITLNGSNSPLTYTQLCVDIPEELFPAPATDVLIRFHQSRRSSGSFYLEDVCVNSGTCVVTPTRLTFRDLQVGCIPSSTPFSINVCATNVDGYVDNTFTGTLTVSGTHLQGTLSQSAVNGCASFSDLQFSTAGDYTLSATGEGLTGDSDIVSVLTQCPTTSNIKVMAYNLLNFPNGRDDCGSDNIVVPARWDSLRKIVQYVQPDVLMVCELQSEFGADMILSNALNVFGNTHYARANFVLNQSPGGTVLNNAFFYNTNKMTLYTQDEVATNVRDIGEYIVYLNDPNLAVHEDTTFIDFYTAHFKAGSTTENAASRASQCMSLDNHTAAKNEHRNAVVGGDFNFYESSEAGYQTLLNSTYPFYDPINTPGNWDNNASFQTVHTQATRRFNSAPMDCGATGGIDSRFDFLLNSASLMNGSKNVAYVVDSYQTLGNDGSSFNDDITDINNQSGVPDSVLNALLHTSDHLPIIMDLVATFPATTLAIDRLDFDLKKENNRAILSWQSINPEIADYFIIQKSNNNQHFVNVEKVVSQTTPTYMSTIPLTLGTTYFRIKQVTANGDIRYSASKSISLFTTSTKIFLNPFEKVIQIQWNEHLQKNKPVMINIYDALGKLVYKRNNIQNNLTIHTNDWQSGVYMIDIMMGEKVDRRKIIK